MGWADSIFMTGNAETDMLWDGYYITISLSETTSHRFVLRVKKYACCTQQIPL
jgi:hypothetical protein